jgi:predicted transcriptional regulator
MPKYYEQKSTIIDLNTGEETVSSKVVYQPFFTQYYTKLFTNNEEILYNVFGVNVETALAIYLISHMDFKNNEVYLLKKQKEELANKIHRNIKSVNNAITSLIKKGLIMKTNTQGCFIVNPSIAFKGNERSRKEILKLFEVKIDNNQLITNFENEK